MRHLLASWRKLASLPEPWRDGYDAKWSELTPVWFLESIREVDREGEGAWLDTLTEQIAENGFTDPVIIEVRPIEVGEPSELRPFDDAGMDSNYVKVLLVEGNHRLSVAKRLGLSEAPAKVLFHDSFRDQGVGLAPPRNMFIKIPFREGWQGDGFKPPSMVFDL